MIFKKWIFKDFKDAYKESRGYFKKEEIAHFPPYVTFELTNICNFRCIMCYASYLKNKKRELDFNLFKKAIDEIARYGSLIRFIGHEEPMLYGKIKDAIRYVKDKGLLLHITTNGSLLNEDMTGLLIDAGVDSVIFSFQGFTRQEYCFMRNVENKVYLKVIDNIKRLYAKKKDGRPYIMITTTITERDDPNSRDNFIREHLKYADEVQVTGFTHFMHLDAQFKKKDIWRSLNISKPKKNIHKNCFAANYEMLIKESGEAYPCCGAFCESLKIGNIHNDRLFDVWHSGKAFKIRKLLWKGELDSFKDCTVCAIRYEYGDIGNTVRSIKVDKYERYTKNSQSNTAA